MIMKSKPRRLLILLSAVLVGIARADDDTLRDLGTTAAPGEIPKWDGTQWRNAHDNITTVTAGAGLTGTMTNGEITVAVTFGGKRTNDLVAAFTDMDATRPPIGAIVAWAKNLNGVPTNLPPGWVECNGQTLNDTNSPLHGTTIPNLNGASGQPKRFLRGSQVSGATGGSDFHQLTIDEMPAHNHACFTHGQYGPSYARVEGAGNSGSTYPTTTSGNNQPHENRPPFYEVVWIMRVK